MSPFPYPFILDPFWSPRLEMNASKAIMHQWQQLQNTGCFENFRLVADKAEGIRLGYFFADSDAYKWLDAAARAYSSHPSLELKARMDELISLIARTQTPDGYIYTYNQLFFPGTRWHNLQIEHELYCHGHLIEAAVSHAQATGENPLLDVAINAADLLVKTFASQGPQGTPGHQEVELALLRLHALTGNHAYFDLAEHFLEQRGRIRTFIRHILATNRSYKERSQQVSCTVQAYLQGHPEYDKRFSLPPDNLAKKPRWGKQRWFLNMASGKYFQQHKPLRKQAVPVGHAVRFAYMETAAAMLCRRQKDEALQRVLEQAWEHMVGWRMYVTGGVGALPDIEGFGRDFELDPFYSYSETCASLGLIFWNWEMAQLTGDAKYADLTEWELYNGAAVGLGQDGTSYLYNNPLSSREGLSRRPWFKCPCCPSNVSRTWADLGKYILLQEGNDLQVQQYIGCEWAREGGKGVKMESGLPWQGKVSLEMRLDKPETFCLYLRIPSWNDQVEVRVNGQEWKAPSRPLLSQRRTACGYDPSQSWYLSIQRPWLPGDRVELEFGMPLRLRFTHPRVKSTRGMAALTRGPLVYCLESIDNPGIDLFTAALDPKSLQVVFSKETFNGIYLLRGATTDGSPLTFLPYYLWANRGPSQMTVYIQTPTSTPESHPYLT